jgi:hypothetical protein
MKAQVDSAKILFVEKRRERLHGCMQGDPEMGGSMRQVGKVPWEGEISPWPIITFWDLLKSVNLSVRVDFNEK